KPTRTGPPRWADHLAAGVTVVWRSRTQVAHAGRMARLPGSVVVVGGRGGGQEQDTGDCPDAC
ncbi:MAG TPA: hypothetical protein VGW74_08640, partial [Propionibacteriaceae bacterium]|nr:hypothetical protein [Propionibacteriaceae bacterium]